MLDASLAHNMRQLVCSDPSSIVGGNGLSTREGAAALEKMCVSLRQKRHALATDMVRHPELTLTLTLTLILNLTLTLTRCVTPRDRGSSTTRATT